MKEVSVRKFHRRLGIVVVWFLAIQAVTGLLLSAFGEWKSPLMAAMATIHHEWNPAGDIYRVILALATAAQGILGIVIFKMMRARMKKA